jgi:hypothetical protein
VQARQRIEQRRRDLQRQCRLIAFDAVLGLGRDHVAHHQALGCRRDCPGGNIDTNCRGSLARRLELLVNVDCHVKNRRKAQCNHVGFVGLRDSRLFVDRRCIGDTASFGCHGAELLFA